MKLSSFPVEAGLTFWLLVTIIGEVWGTDCPDTWWAFEGSCYLVTPASRFNFVDAEHYCRLHGGHLVHINSAEENAFLVKFLKMIIPGNYWMGLTDEQTEGVYKWYDTDEVATFTNWGPGQPNNAGGVQDCVFLHVDIGFAWNDAPCQNMYEPLCEKRPDEVLHVVG